MFKRKQGRRHGNDAEVAEVRAWLTDVVAAVDEADELSGQHFRQEDGLSASR